MKNKAVYRFLALMLSVGCLVESFYMCEALPANEAKSDGSTYSETGYIGYSSTVSDTSVADGDIELNMSSCGVSLKTDSETSQQYAEINEGDQPLTFNVDIPKTALYELQLTYRAADDTSNDIYISFAVDGKSPYDELGSIRLHKFWKDDGEIRTLENGNQVAPSQKQVRKFTTQRLTDTAGLAGGALKIKLESGKHTISIGANSASVQISGIMLAAPLKITDYASKSAEYSSKENSTQKTITVQGEDAVLKTSKSLVAKCDNSEASLTPSDPSLDVVNYIGSSNWGTVGDEITWEIDVKESGLYQIGYHFRQSYILGGLSYRALKIDGEIPFKEAESIPFSYDSGWQYGVFENEKGEPYYFSLEKGKHTISLTVSMGDVAQYNARMSETVLKIGKLYRQIVMITGETPDANRDYNLFSQIPDFKENLEAIRAELDSVAEGLSQMVGTRSNSQISVIRNMSDTITRILEHPYQATDYKKDFYSNYGSLGTVLYEMRKLPLDIDEIQLIPKGGKIQTKNDGFWDGVVFSIKRFIASFTNDYNSVSATNSGDQELTIWLNWGRDQVQVLNGLVDSSFTVETGINVNIKIANASLIQAMLSNNGPDLSLRLSRSQPVDYAMRGALYDLRNFEDFEETCKRFMKSATVPYEFNGGCYAIPDTQSFYMLFYRKDILEELGLEIPQTWDDFLKTTSILARKNMQVGLPYTQITSVTTTDSGIGALNLFPTVLLQFGGKLYSEDHSSTMLTSTVSVQAFRYWTDFYTKYSAPVTYDFYNRFRSGEMPIAIQPYTQYATISAAATEINGLWGVAPIPGFKLDNGTINNVETGGGTGSVILEQSEHKEEAWEFLKWWTSTEIQLRYTNELEAILGPAERQPSANIEAVKGMSWSSDERKMLLEQWKNVEELPEVPGGYYTSRCVEQAYWNVVNSAANPKSTVIKWGKLADMEIQRKRAEYHLE